MDVSVIIPVYNAEKTIAKAIDSILKQDTNFKYEIICVDDGSSDSSLSILKSYKDKIKVISQKNQGPGAARNAAIKVSSAGFLMFLDSDDYVSSNFVDKMYQSVLDYEADIVICNFVRVDEQGNKNYIDKGDFAIYEKGEINETLLMEFHSCNRIIKRELMLKNPYPKGMFYEDVVSISKAQIAASKIVKINDYLYYYYHNEASTTRSINKTNLDMIKAIDKIRNTFIKAEYDEELEFLYVNNLLVDLFIKLVKARQTKKAITLKEEVENLYPKWYKNKYLKEVKLSKKLYLFFLRKSYYRTIERVFGK